MPALDLLHNIGSRKNANLDDPRYNNVNTLKKPQITVLKPTFTLYDEKDTKKTAIKDITLSYELSDKKVSLGEIMNKILDIIVSFDEGNDAVFDINEDHVYTWKYANELKKMMEEKIVKGETVVEYDNRFKYLTINSKLMSEKFPGKYTLRTDFTNKKTLQGLVNDLKTVFFDDVMPKLQEAAIADSERIAEEDTNPILEKIRDWGVSKYGCKVEFTRTAIKPEDSILYHSEQALILHLKNGYDLSIVGTYGTEYDDQFDVSVFDASTVEIKTNNETKDVDIVKSEIAKTANYERVVPFTKLAEREEEKRRKITEVYELLKKRCPMISEDVLELEPAEGIVGPLYLSSCTANRKSGVGLPEGYTVEDAEREGTIDFGFADDNFNDFSMEERSETVEAIEELDNIMNENNKSDIEEPELEEVDAEEAENTEESVDELVDIGEEPLQNKETLEENDDVNMELTPDEPAVKDIQEKKTVDLFGDDEKGPEETAKVGTPEVVGLLFDDIKQKESEPEVSNGFGVSNTQKKQYNTLMPFGLDDGTKHVTTSEQIQTFKNKTENYNASSTLLPGFTPEPAHEEPKPEPAPENKVNIEPVDSSNMSIDDMFA